ncbi:non-ribosomal peptide synthetase [Janthinobacterium agaricidamnosum]|uniref:JagD n=2 Tax=Janthinobacterium agaricidamnosum TaxID=55508 RepID=W0V0L4_9BURK|nr:non-ribosomal peptide synthetase [Janthinobacterium agaricidamnosum]CCJ67648.1 JagD [Janthinobacterium agaricidamnosum]CDG80827.1 JagD [Janthinobacterium agaricidamnosum NBRC 102515 = DSM 9628]
MSDVLNQIVNQAAGEAAGELVNEVVNTVFSDADLADAELLSMLDALGDDDGAFDPLRIPRLAASSAALSYAQQRLWFFEQLEPGSAFFNMPASVRLLGRLDSAALARSLNEIVRRHEALRTSFIAEDGTPRQRIAAQLALDLPLTDLSGLEPGARQEAARRLAQQAACQPFDLERGPLIRASLVRLGPNEHIVTLTLHHIVSDGWSMGVLVGEVAALYGAFVQGLPSPLPELPIQYADFAQWQRQWLAGGVLEQQLGYWRRQLAGADELLALPTDRPRPPRQRYQGATLSFTLPAPLTRALHALGERHQATLFMTLTAVFNVLLARYSGQSDICLGTVIANRNRPQTEALIGFFVNTLVLRSRIDGAASFADLLRQVRGTALDAYAHQDVPFEQLVEALKPERQPGHTPLFQAMLLLQNMPTGTLELPGLTLSQVAAERAVAKFDLTLYLQEEGEQLAGAFEYNTDLFDAASIARMAGHFSHLLQAVADHPQACIDQLPLCDWRAMPPVAALARDAALQPLSPHQERMWFIDVFEAGHLYPASPTYHNIPLLLELEGPLPVSVIQAALDALMARHAILRTRIETREARGWQRLDDTARLPLRELDAADPGADPVALALADAAQPFTLERDLLVRAALVRGAARTLLAITAHHIIADRASMRLLARDLLELCAALLEQRAPRLPPLRVEHADYVAWRDGLDPAHTEALFFYWKRQLRGRLQALELPLNRARPAVHTFSAARHEFTIDAGLAGRLRALAARSGSGLFDVAACAFNALLRRYAGHDEIVIGTSAPWRERAELAGVVGPFANLLVLRNVIGQDSTLLDLLRQGALGREQALRHQDMQFDQLALRLKPEKDMSRTALFDVLFQLEEDDAALAAGALRARVIETNLGYGKNDLHLCLHAERDSLAGRLVYNADFFDPWLAAQMMRHYVVLLEALADDPGQRIDDVALLDRTETGRQLYDWNDSQASYPDTQTVHQLFELQAARVPQRIAVTFEGAGLSYQELNRRANRLAHYLRHQGVGAESLVALCLERSFDMIVAILAVMKAGGAYVPIDPQYPAERIAYMLSDSGSRWVITSSALADALDGLKAAPQASLIALDSAARAIAAEAEHNPPNLNQPRHLVYVIYTSGSTGQPKGTLLEHRNVVRLLCNDRLQFAIGEQDVWSMLHSYAFDFTVWELYGALLHGGRVALVSKTARQDPVLLLDQLLEQQVSVLSQTPTAFYNLIDEMARRPGLALPALRYVVFGGEGLNPLKLKAFRAAHPQVELINMYGITETCVHVTFKRLGDDDMHSGASNIGRPIPTTTTYIMDHRQRLLPAGVPGEICVGGLGVGRGYLNREQLTRERFVDHPYLPGERLYRSGDLAKLLENGDMVYLGRIDNQVQLRGFRVELGEIEAALLALPAVRDVAVRAREDAPGDTRLVAYLVPQAGGAALDPVLLRTALLQTLPEYMVPAHFIALVRLPLTPNGKVDSRALPAPGASRSEAAYVAPATPVEQALAAIWAEVLGLDKVGAQDNFFALGGHSLLATQVMSKVRVAFGAELPLRVMFEAPSVAALAQRIVPAQRHDAPATIPPARATIGDAAPPLSFAQQRLWFLDQLEPGSALYNIPAALRLGGRLDVAALRRTINQIVARHAVLRTTFAARDGAPVQLVAPRLELGLPLTDLGGLAPAEREARAHALAGAEAAAPFDLARGPLIRAALLRLDDSEHVLLFTVHHSVADGWSIGVLVREVAALYAAYADGAWVEGQASPLAPLPLQYGDFAHWQRTWLSGAVLQRQLDYWRAQLAGAPALLALPTDRPRPPLQSYRGATLPFDVPAATLAGLAALGRQQQATLFMTLAAAFSVLLSRYSGQADLCIGTPIANRNRAETEGLIGFFVNTLVLRARVERGDSFASLLRQVRATALGAYAHQDVPFEQLVEALKPERHLSHAPLFQVMLVLQNAPMDTLQLPGLTLRPLQAPNTVAKFDLTLNLIEQEGRLLAAFEYNTDLFDAATIARMAGHYNELLGAVAADASCRIGDLAMLSPAERNRLLVEWNATAAPYPDTVGVHRLFEAQAARTPHRPALRFGALELSYAELNARANRLAHHLRGLGVGPETLVGLCVARSADMIVGLLGILKAGGAYVPLDPAHPPQRLRHMLEDARPPVLLTQRRLLPGLPLDGMERIAAVCLDDEEVAAVRGDDNNPPDATLPEQLAYVIYTSGSSGKPKGVQICHRNLAASTAARIGYYRPAGRHLLMSPVSFDSSVALIFGSLLSGATLLVPDDDSVRDPALLAALIREQQVSTLLCVPSLYAELLRACQPAPDWALRQAIVAGESCAPELVRSSHARWPQVELYNEYGPTEGTVWASVYRTAPDDARGIVPIGRAIANTRIYILDGGLQPVPVGVAGELHIAGDGLARGYLRRADLSADKFMPDPFGAAPGARMYRTGDLARYLADGNIEYLGRIDQQVKIRGFRIELDEIEAALASLPGVSAGLVLVREDAPGDKRLAAYLLARADARQDSLAPPALRAALARLLPEYMVPAHFIVLEQWPLTPNGKIDRQALPAPDMARGESGYVAPDTPQEAALAAIWAEVLGRDRAGVLDNFFESGGHSLLGLRLVQQARIALGASIPVAALFAAPTPRALAAWMDAHRGAPAASGDAGALVSLGGAPEANTVFLLHDIGGRVTSYASVAAALVRHGYAVAALQLSGHEAALPDSFEALVARSVAAIRGRQPAGPYRLAGHSYGGVLAAHIAAQLEAEGERIEFLGVLDSVPLAPGTVPLAAAADPLERCMYIAVACAAAAGAHGMAFERRQFAALADSQARWRLILAMLARAGLCADAGDTAELAALDRAFGRLALLPVAPLPRLRRAPEVWNCAAHDADFGLEWAACSGAAVRSHRCDGDHVSMLSGPAGAALGGALAAALRRCAAGAQDVQDHPS